MMNRRHSVLSCRCWYDHIDMVCWVHVANLTYHECVCMCMHAVCVCVAYLSVRVWLCVCVSCGIRVVFAYYYNT